MEISKISSWVIMDKKRRVIARGVPRSRELRFVEDEKGSQRLLTYGSKKKAESGYKVSGFYTHSGEGVKEYLEKEYGYGKRWQENGEWRYSRVEFEQFLEAVQIEITIKEK